MEFFTVDLHGYEAKLPVLPLPSGVKICFFNLHGNVELTEHCAKELAKMVSDCDVLLTAESKGLQLTHAMARDLGQPYYAVARKSKKLYMQDGLEVEINSSITTGAKQKLYISKFDADLLKGKKVGIIDDVVSTGNSLLGLEELVRLAGGISARFPFCNGTLYCSLFAEIKRKRRNAVVEIASDLCCEHNGKSNDIFTTYRVFEYSDA